MRSLIASLLIAGVIVGAGCATTTGRLTRDVIRPAEGDAVLYREELIARARTRRLSQRTAWLRLGHWHDQTSQADGPNFFLAANGRTSPSAELEATVRAFFGSLPEGADDVQHPICQFPARYRWLARELGFDPARLPKPACPRFAAFHAELDAERLSFVFSSYYLNNPASVFGHTFVRVIKRSTADGRRELLDHAIEFSATVDTGNALLYGFKGLVGLFPGTFRNVPYHFKVRQYNDYESRDLYEYELALTPDEIEMFLAHLWELGSTYFDYFYVSENCSYHLLGALEAARPTLSLLAHMHWPVIPADTIKALFANPGLVKAVHFRPSLRLQFRERLRRMPEADHALVEQLAHRPATPLPVALPRSRALDVLDATQDLIDIRHAKALVHQTDSEPARAKQQLLERRAEIALPSAPVVVRTPWKRMPQLGHASRRVGLGAGVDDARDPSIAVDVRLALHDLADPTPGYPELSQLEFLPIRARLRLDGRRGELDSASLVRILSLSPQDRFERKLSWKLDAGAIRFADDGCPDGCYAARLLVGTGAALATETARIIMFATLDLQLASGPHLQGIEDLPLRAGLGPAAGLRIRIADRIVWLATGELSWLPAQRPTALWQAQSILRFGLGRWLALSLEAKLDAQRASGQAMYLVYF